MNKEQAIKKVWDSIGSIFTKEDVVALIEGIETEGGLDFDVSELIEHVEDAIGNIDSMDVIDTSTADFSLSGNEINLDHVDVDTSYLQGEVSGAINEFFDNK